MDEMNKNAGSGFSDQNPAGSSGENQEEIKIWHRPESGKKKRYVYEVKTEEPEEEKAKTEKTGFEESETGGMKSENQTTEDWKREDYRETADPSNRAEDPSKQTAGQSKQTTGSSQQKKQAAEDPDSGKKSRRRNKSSERSAKKHAQENLLEKDNVSKKTRQQIWKSRMVEGSHGENSFFQRAAENFRKNYKKILITALVLVLVVGAGYFYNRNRKYHSYDVEWQIPAAETGYSDYLSFNDVILHYSQDGVSCINQNGEVIWNQAFNMDVPGIAVAGEYAVIYDVKGTSLYICNAKGCTGKAETTKKILKADISAAGVTAVVLDDKTSNYINYFRKDGSQIDLEIKTLISGNGYPLDIAISPDGNQLVGSYIYTDAGELMNQVVFWNFEVGKNDVDRVVGGFKHYKETLVPEVLYFDNENSAAVVENAIDFYSTRNAMEPELAKTEEFDSRIKTVFYNDEYIAVVLDQQKTKAEEKSETAQAADEGTAEAKQPEAVSYTMRVFNKTGEQVFEREIDFEYDYVKFSGDGIVAYNNSECAVYNLNGVCKYQAKLDITIDGVMRVAENCIIVYGNEALQKLSLK